MTDREEKLDELERELRKRIDKPYIEQPDERDVGIGGACFLDRKRLCGPDCTSFIDPQAPTAAERCTILSGINTGLEMLGELVQLQRNPVRAVRAVAEAPAVPSIPPPYTRLKEQP